MSKNWKWTIIIVVIVGLAWWACKTGRISMNMNGTSTA